MRNLAKYTLIIGLFLCLVLVRKYEEVLFYDPFLAYFHGDFLLDKYPEYNLPKVIINVVFRYALNTILSLAIIGLLFLRRKYILFASIVFLVFLILLVPTYIFFVENQFQFGQNIGFYVRRFLIQPVLLLILIPALFYQQMTEKKAGKTAK